MQFIFRSRRFGAAALGVTGLGAAAVTLAAFPTIAQGAVAAVTSVSCSVTGSNWCISGNNSSSGIGVIGTSKSGTGLRGTSTSQYGLKATSGSNTAIFAQTTSGPSAITAVGSSTGNGVSASGGGVGLSASSTGTSAKTANIGVLGTSAIGTGVYGLSTGSDGTGVYGFSKNGDGGQFQSTSGYAVSGTSDGVAAYFQGNQVAIRVFANSNGDALDIYNNDGQVIFAVDGQGNVTYRGSLESSARTVGGGAVGSFGPNSTQPTVEDTGTAQLVRGIAVVRLDPAFVASIEPATGYRVFVTPDGETNGLFVAGKTTDGFVVRESHAGRSTVTFDYRIVATKLDAARQHMATLSPAEARTFGTHAPLPALPAVTLPARLPAPAGETTTP